jgi:putative ABC transport system permease protein
MAWRDSRRNRSRLFLFISSIILGIASLVAIYSLGDNMRQEIDAQAAQLLGADLEFSGNKPASPPFLQTIDSLSEQYSEERSFVSMALFPGNGGTRLVQVKALSGTFPYYGALETNPKQAAQAFRKKQEALVDQTLMLQFNLKNGDSVKLGNTTFIIAGALLKAPGQTGLSASISPVVYIPLSYLEATGLSQKGSRINYKYYLKTAANIDINKTIEKLETRLNAENLNYESIASQKEETNRSFRDVTRFLSLIGFIALLLGCIGVASAIHIYVKEKNNSIAILRCVGATSNQAFLIYLIQIFFVGLLGSFTGAILGVIIQQFLPAVLGEFFPIIIKPTISWSAVWIGILVGVLVALLFALLPLLNIRMISPLQAIRQAFQNQKTKKDPWRWMVYSLIIAAVFFFTWLQLSNWQQAIMFCISIVIAFLVLAGVAYLLMWMVRRFFPGSWNYLFRQGMANLFRPNNQTTLLVVSIGFGTALICILIFIQSILLNRVTLSASGNQPNMVLFDIQSGQRQDVAAFTRQQGLPVIEMVPIVTMRLEKVNNITAATLQADSTIRMQRWIFSREYRVTFRDTLASTEKLVEGKWAGKADPGKDIQVSVEQNFAKRNQIKIGDTMHFNVQGAMMPVIVSSFREVDWNRVQTNFLVVFPEGVLEEAPQFHVLMTKVPDQKKAAQFQQVMVRQFPNVSIIDLGTILNVVDEIIDKIGFVIRFMAGFSILTGLIVLIASVLISKFQRMEESVLLRTLGASRRQIFVIIGLEYFFLGALAAATGIVLAYFGSWALARYIFEAPFTPDLWPILAIFLSVCLLTVLIGLLNSREVLNKPPLEILRSEA